MTAFAQTGVRKRGYDTEQVDAFLERARTAYERNDVSAVRSGDIRLAAFDLRRNGYDTAEVDAALERLEDVFAEREREQAQTTIGEGQWLDQAKATARVIVAHLSRPGRKKFARTSIFGVGYHRDDVDRLARRLVLHLQDGFPITVDDVRRTVFRPQRGGYKEHQVDLLLDDMVSVMLAVR